MVFGILVPQPGTKPLRPAVEAQSLNHWTTREVPKHSYLNEYLQKKNVTHNLNL